MFLHIRVWKDYEIENFNLSCILKKYSSLCSSTMRFKLRKPISKLLSASVAFFINIRCPTKKYTLKWTFASSNEENEEISGIRQELPVDACLERLRVICRRKNRHGERVLVSRSHREKRVGK